MAAHIQFIGTSSPDLCAGISAPPAVWFDSILSGDREFKLCRELKVPVSISDGLFVLETRSIPIMAYGESLADGITDFQNQFAVVWDRIAMESDDRLTADAQAAKRSQLDLVQEVIRRA